MEKQAEMMKEKIDEMIDFFEFSLKSDAKYSGAISFCLKTEWNTEEAFTVRIVDDGDSKIAVAKRGIEEPTIVVSMTANDFFYIYTGEASVFEVSRMIMRRRIAVTNFEYGKVSTFASCFDYSTESWNEFYKYKDMIVENRNRFHRLFQLPLLKNMVPYRMTIPDLNFTPISSFPLSFRSITHYNFITSFSVLSPLLYRIRNNIPVQLPSCLEEDNSFHQHHENIKLREKQGESELQSIKDELVTEKTFLEIERQLHKKQVQTRRARALASIRQTSWEILRPISVNENIFYNHLCDVTNAEAWYCTIKEFDCKQLIHTVKYNITHTAPHEYLIAFWKGLIGRVDHKPGDYGV